MKVMGKKNASVFLASLFWNLAIEKKIGRILNIGNLKKHVIFSSFIF
jgi:hypothetical protein